MTKGQFELLVSARGSNSLVFMNFLKLLLAVFPSNSIGLIYIQNSFVIGTNFLTRVNKCFCVGDYILRHRFQTFQMRYYSFQVSGTEYICYLYEDRNDFSCNGYNEEPQQAPHLANVCMTVAIHNFNGKKF